VDVAPAEALTFSGCSMYRRHGRDDRRAVVTLTTGRHVVHLRPNVGCGHGGRFVFGAEVTLTAKIGVRRTLLRHVVRRGPDSRIYHGSKKLTVIAREQRHT
jgi:hypothetical protein